MKTHLDIKTRYVQFRILHRYIGTNHQVSKFRDDIPDKCTFCEKKYEDTENNETIQHLFFKCETTNNLINTYYEKHLTEEIEHLNEENFIFSPLTKNDDTDNLLKNVNMLIKFYLWSCKMRKMIPTLETCEKYVKYHALCIAKGLEISGNYNFMKKITENKITNSESAMEISELKRAPPAPQLPGEGQNVNFSSAVLFKIRKLRSQRIQRVINTLIKNKS